MPEHRFGRLPSPDARDRLHPLRALTPRGMVRPKSKYWSLSFGGTIFDQTQYSGKDGSSCVGHAWHAFLRASPLCTKQPEPLTIYHAAQTLDEWPGEDYEGTSVRGGARYLTEQVRQINSYAWAFSIGEVLDWLAWKGSVVFGIDWLAGMEETDGHGFVHATGDVLGGHAICCVGYSDDRKAVRLHNSWGKDWGQNGRCWLGYDDADRLIKGGGEVCVAVEQKATT